MPPTIETLLRTDMKIVDKRDPVSTVMGWIRGDSTKAPIVMDDGSPFGIPNERSLVTRSLPQTTHLDRFTLVTRALPTNATLDEAAARMAELRAPYLPVADARGKLLGYVTAVDVARERGVDGNARDMSVRVKSLREQDTIGDALHLFTQEYVPFLPVMDGNGRVSGVLPRSMVLRMGSESVDKGRKDAGGEKLHLHEDAVAGFMTGSPSLVPASAGADEVLDRVEANGYAIVQERDGSVAGVVTPETLLRGR